MYLARIKLDGQTITVMCDKFARSTELSGYYILQDCYHFTIADTFNVRNHFVRREDILFVSEGDVVVEEEEAAEEEEIEEEESIIEYEDLDEFVSE